MKMFLWIMLLILGTLILVLGWISYPWSIKESIKYPELINIDPIDLEDTDEQSGVIKIITFNTAFLYGRGSEGPGYKHEEAEFYHKNLVRMSEELKKADADVVCLQEIDFNSSRSHHINQAQYIAKAAGYPYVAEAHSWVSHYIPFPYWPLKNNFGSMVSGGAILSKYPLSNHEVTLLAKPKSQPWWYNLFYLHRYFQKVTVSFGEKNINLINLHLEAFDKDDRQNQLIKLVKKIEAEKIDIVTGDFNMLPRNAAQKSRFYNDDNYEDDSSYEIMMKSGLSEVIPEEIYNKAENLYFTFPAWNPDRRLDYIWFRPGLKMMKAEVLPSALSDHLPLRASFQISIPKFNPYSQ
jgi:endonuclease/exonuclease/phosphatase family metal-dependent hydrolase